MWKDWDIYKDLEYYPWLCACGCGSKIEVKPHHKYRKESPRFVYRHAKGRDLKLVAEVEAILSGEKEALFCGCGCGERINVQPHHMYQGIPKYISGHNTRVTGAPSKRPEVRELLSEQKMGDNNPSKRPDVKEKLSKSHEGKVRTEESRKKQGESTRNSDKFHNSMKKRIPPRKGTKTSKKALKNLADAAAKRKREDTKYITGYMEIPFSPEPIFYRSSYERDALSLFCDISELETVESETIRIPYYDSSEKQRTYIPDFLLTFFSGEQLLVEVRPKGFVLSDPWIHMSNLPKFEAAQKWAEDNEVVFCIWTEDFLYNNSSTTKMSSQAIVEATVSSQVLQELADGIV